MPAPNGHGSMPGSWMLAILPAPMHVGQQQDGDERRHHEVEIAEAAVRDLVRFDVLELGPRHARNA